MTPRIFILSFDKNGAIDHTVKKQLLDFIPNQVGSESAADVVCVPISYLSSYVFNTKLLEIKKKWIAIDFLEYGWSWSQESPNLLGHGNLAKCDFLNTPEYAKLDEFVKEHPPALTFKRELRQSDVTPKIVPADWLCYLPAKPLQSKEQFDARPFDFINVWGLSNPMRQELHGDVFKGAHKYGYNVLDNLAHEQHLEKRNVVSIYSPWFARTSIENIMRWQRRAKISVSCWGAGKKCFRSGESIVDCIMALPYDDLAWSIPFVHGENCIRLRTEHLLDDLLHATQWPGLYDIYQNSYATAEKYRSANWVRDFFMKHLEAVL